MVERDWDGLICVQRVTLEWEERENCMFEMILGCFWLEVSLGLCALGGLAITEIASAVTNKTDRVFATLNSSISHCAMEKKNK